MTQRLQKILAAAGIASRRHAEELIAAGRVSCNGRVCALGESADPEKDRICVDGRPIPSAAPPVYILLHKPRGYVTTLSDEKGRPNVSQLVRQCPVRVYPVGRLDMDSEGLLLMTNDGAFAYEMMHPKHEIEKAYRVWVTHFSSGKLRSLAEPVELDGYRIQPPRLTVLEQNGENALLEIVIHEGRNRQIRRMCALAGMQVRRLQRIREGSLLLGELPPGQWRYLTPQELSLLRENG